MDDREDVAVAGFRSGQSCAARQFDVIAAALAAQQVDARQVGDETRTGPRGDLGRRSALHDLSMFEDDEPVSKGDRLERVVRSEERRVGKELSAMWWPSG